MTVFNVSAQLEKGRADLAKYNEIVFGAMGSPEFLDFLDCRDVELDDVPESNDMILGSGPQVSKFRNHLI
jgi:hypothetical protein